METSWNVATKTAAASWKNVFKTDFPLYYEVSVSLEDGEGNLIQWQETTDEEIDLAIDTDIIPETGSNLKFSVRAINHSGYFENVDGDLFVPGI